MIKDKMFKTLLIPLLGIAIPFMAGLVNYYELSWIACLFSTVFFIGVSHIIWRGSVKLFSFLRSHNNLRQNIFLKLFALCVATVLYGVSVVLISSTIWQLLVLKKIFFIPVFKAVQITSLAVIILTLIYELLFLNAELELDAKVLKQLDNERVQAEINVLQNELDPHFLFNCLNTVSYLARNDGEKAYQFIRRLSNVLKYFLINKQKDFVSLTEEINFLEDYYFLLQVRFDESIHINNTIQESGEQIQLLPCTLQALVENAIKHNFFSEKEPLEIVIAMNNYNITVSNYIKPKKSGDDSTGIGLVNLKARYRLVMNKNILVQTTANKFLVRIPFVRK